MLRALERGRPIPDDPAVCAGPAFEGGLLDGLVDGLDILLLTGRTKEVRVRTTS
jgi:hypothetical protein